MNARHAINILKDIVHWNRNHGSQTRFNDLLDEAESRIKLHDHGGGSRWSDPCCVCDKSDKKMSFRIPAFGLSYCAECYDRMFLWLMKNALKDWPEVGDENVLSFLENAITKEPPDA